MSSPRFRIDGDGRPDTTGQESRRYLLFAGTQQPPNGGLGDLMDTFTSEEAARRAFREVRLGTSSTTGWAQLAVVDGHDGIKPLCWFGIGAGPEPRRPATGPPAPEPKVISARRPYVSNRTTLLITALVAVATAMIAVLVDSDGTPPPVNRQPAVSVPAEASR